MIFHTEISKIYQEELLLTKQYVIRHSKLLAILNITDINTDSGQWSPIYLIKLDILLTQSVDLFDDQQQLMNYINPYH